MSSSPTKVLSSVSAAAAVVAILFVAPVQATIIQYGFTVSGNWFNSQGNPYGMPFSPSLAGTVTVDNTQSGAAALVDFALATGSHTWTESEFAGPTAIFNFDGGGNLTNFSLNQFTDPGVGYMYIYSNNTMGVGERNQSNACNNCVSLGQGSPVPEPATLALLGLGIAGLGFSRRKQ